MAGRVGQRRRFALTSAIKKMGMDIPRILSNFIASKKLEIKQKKDKFTIYRSISY